MGLASLDSLKIFCDVARQRSFSRGAALNGVSQSAASQTALQLEKRMGVQLIDRSKRPFHLTPEGQVFYEGCLDLLDRYVELETRVRARHEETSNTLNVAMIYSLVLYDMGRLAQRLHGRLPGAQVRFQCLHPREVYEKVLNEQADLGLVSYPKPMREIVVAPWLEEPMALACPPGHPFANGSPVSLENLENQDFIAFEGDLAIRRAIDRFLRRRKIEVRVVMEFDNIEAIKRGIETGAGVSILPEPTVRAERANGSLAVVPVEGLDLVRPLAMIHRRGRKPTAAMQAFIEILADQGSGQEPGRSPETRIAEERATSAPPAPVHMAVPL